MKVDWRAFDIQFKKKKKNRAHPVVFEKNPVNFEQDKQSLRACLGIGMVQVSRLEIERKQVANQQGARLGWGETKERKMQSGKRKLKVRKKEKIRFNLKKEQNEWKGNSQHNQN